MSGGDGRDDALGRRRFLEATGAALGLLAVGEGCSSDGADGDGQTPAGSGGAPAGEPASSGAGGSGEPQPPPGAAGVQGPPVVGPGDAGESAETGGSGAAAGAETPQGGDPGTTPPAAPGVPVGIAGHADVDEAVAAAVALAGGLDAIKPGDSVFIKPNVVSDRALGSDAIRTSLEVVAAVVRLVKARDPGRIVVGDRSARAFDTNSVFDNVGIADVVLAAGADEVYPAPSASEDPDAWVLVQPQGWEETWSAGGGVLAMRRILESDHLINVPTCKDHRYAAFSMSLKNFIGAVEDSSRDPLHYLPTDFDALGRQIALLNQPFEPLLNILDARVALINGGPQGDGSDAVRTTPGLIMASRDRLALDAAGVSLIKLGLERTTVPAPDAAHATLMSTSPWALPQLVHGAAQGLGVSGPEQASLLFDQVEDEAELTRIFQA